MFTAFVYILAAVVIFSIVALVAARVFLKKPWHDTIKWLFEFFS